MAINPNTGEVDKKRQIEKLKTITALISGHKNVYDSGKLDVINKINEIIDRLNDE